jgi:hypothetical protein
MTGRFPIAWCWNSMRDLWIGVADMTYTVMTFVAKVKPDSVQVLGKLLDQIGADPETNSLVPFRSLKTLHFSSFVLHQSDDYGPYLIFENNFDGALDDYLPDLYAKTSAGLHQIYSCCQDYRVANSSDQQGLLGYLRQHVVRPNAYHIGNTGRSVDRILREQKLRDALETQADGLVKNAPTATPRALLASLQKFVSNGREWSWVPEAGARQTFIEKYVPYAKFLLAIVVAILLAPLWIGPLLVVAAVLRYKESTDPIQIDAADLQNVQDLVDKEDHTHSVQNHMASITIVKPGCLRRVTLWSVLAAINLIARATATNGQLSGIPSIHFAHWSLIDGGRRLLFLSNFDGSWENYLDDFIDKAAHGLTGVWSNTLNFPRTYLLIWGGATDGSRFKAVARNSQTVTNAWYSAYRDLTVQGIDNNSSIREDVFITNDAKATRTWLRRL